MIDREVWKQVRNRGKLNKETDWGGKLSDCLKLTKRNIDVHITKCWRSIGPGEITASYLRKASQRLTYCLSSMNISSIQNDAQWLPFIHFKILVLSTCSPRYCEWQTENLLSRRVTAVWHFTQIDTKLERWLCNTTWKSNQPASQILTIIKVNSSHLSQISILKTLIFWRSIAKFSGSYYFFNLNLFNLIIQTLIMKLDLFVEIYFLDYQ